MIHKNTNISNLRFMSIGLACLFGLGLLSGCAGNKETPMTESRPVEQIYNEATDAMQNRRFQTAATLFDEVERQHPYSEWATRAKLMAAYAHYESKEYDRAIFALDRFIQMHPGNERVDYAYYLKALCYYEQISDTRRDQKMTELAMENLDEVVRRFPNSDYARDARFKMDLTLDHLAGREMGVGRYYLNRGEYQAAKNRFTNVVKQYETTTHVAEALYRLVEINVILGLMQEAERNAAVLGHNYPGSDWYQDAYALVTGKSEFRSAPDGFVKRAWRSVTN